MRYESWFDSKLTIKFKKRTEGGGKKQERQKDRS
jgi:hypothetical protein